MRAAAGQSLHTLCMGLLANLIVETFMCGIKALLGLLLAGFMGTAVADGPDYPGGLASQNVSINATLSGLRPAITDAPRFDIGPATPEAIATTEGVIPPFGSGSGPIHDPILLDRGDVHYSFDNSLDAGGALASSAGLAPSTLGAPGIYPSVVTGTMAASAGGIHAGALSAAPAREPNEWMLMLAGIGLVGMMIDRVKHRTL